MSVNTRVKNLLLKGPSLLTCFNILWHIHAAITKQVEKIITWNIWAVSKEWTVLVHVLYFTIQICSSVWYISLQIYWTELMSYWRGCVHASLICIFLKAMEVIVCLCFLFLFPCASTLYLSERVVNMNNNSYYNDMVSPGANQ
jgi:hypothetical protein